MLRASEWEAEFDLFFDYSLILAASHTADCAEFFFATPDTLTTQRWDAQWKWSQRLAGDVHELGSSLLTFMHLVDSWKPFTILIYFLKNCYPTRAQPPMLPTINFSELACMACIRHLFCANWNFQLTEERKRAWKLHRNWLYKWHNSSFRFQAINNVAGSFSAKPSIIHSTKSTFDGFSQRENIF